MQKSQKIRFPFSNKSGVPWVPPFHRSHTSPIQYSRNSSEDDSDVAICFNESDISFFEDLEANDYNTKELQTSDFVLCKFSTEKWLIAITNVGVEYKVKFLRKLHWGWLYVS